MVKIKFEAGEDLLETTVKNQAGTPEKSFQEGLQNSDDEESTVIELTVTETRATLIDNGNGLEPLENGFKLFGQSSKKGKPNKIGTFGIGKGQIFCMGKTTYRSKNYIVKIDISQGMEFDVDTVPEFYKGCRIDIEFYPEKVLSTVRVQRVVENLLKAVRFKRSKVIINGKTVEPVDMSDAIEHDGTFFKKMEGCDSRLFVKGMLISKLRESEMIENGDVFCDYLELNMARNEPIENADYLRYKKSLDAINASLIKNFDNRKTAGSKLEIIVDQFEKGSVKEDDIDGIKCIPSYQSDIFYNPKHLKAMMALGKKIVNVRRITMAERNKFANGYKDNHQEDVVIDVESRICNFMEKMGVPIFDLSRDHDAMNQIQKAIEKGATTVYRDDLGQKRKGLVDLISRMNREIGGVINDYRTLSFVKDAPFGARTDGRGWIKINFDQIDWNGGKYFALIDAYFLLVHEYGHDTDDEQTMGHDSGFKERFYSVNMKAKGILKTFTKEVA